MSSLASEPTPVRSIRDRHYKYIRNFRPELEFTNNVLTYSKTWASWEALAPDEPALAARMLQLLRRPAEELYDLTEDPWELRNQAASPEYAPIKQRLAGELEAWMRSNADPVAALLPR